MRKRDKRTVLKKKKEDSKRQNSFKIPRQNLGLRDALKDGRTTE